MDDEMSPQGRSRSVTDEELLEVAKNTPGPVFSTGEVAEDVEIGRERVRQIFNELAEDGVLEYKQIGSGRAFWFRGR